LTKHEVNMDSASKRAQSRYHALHVEMLLGSYKPRIR
jgi:hypothetical protein